MSEDSGTARAAALSKGRRFAIGGVGVVLLGLAVTNEVVLGHDGAGSAAAVALGSLALFVAWAGLLPSNVSVAGATVDLNTRVVEAAVKASDNPGKTLSALKSNPDPEVAHAAQNVLERIMQPFISGADDEVTLLTPGELVPGSPYYASLWADVDGPKFVKIVVRDAPPWLNQDLLEALRTPADASGPETVVLVHPSEWESEVVRRGIEASGLEGIRHRLILVSDAESSLRALFRDLGRRRRPLRPDAPEYTILVHP